MFTKTEGWEWCNGLFIFKRWTVRYKLFGITVYKVQGEKML